MLAQLEAKLFGTGEAQPFRVGRFTVLEKLGAGGMGVVHAAFDPDLERKIAVKFLHHEFVDDDDRNHARLLREAQALARLDHPNVVSVYDVGTYDGGVYVAMEFVRGQSLQAWIEEGSPSAAEILDAYSQAGRGLAAAHAAGVVHRDFKPANAIMGDDGRVRVLDFGLAARDDRIADEPERDDRGDDETMNTGGFARALTRTGAVLGTPLYMAPEQHMGERADARCDQFALCVSLWIALFKERPFEGETMAQLRLNVVEGNLRELPPRAAGVSRRVRDALVRGLNPDPDRRFATMDELLVELDWSGRRRRATALSIAGVLVAGALGGVIAWQVKAQAVPTICESARNEIDQIWNEAVAMDATARFGQTEAASTWQRVNTGFDAYTRKWRDALASNCEAPEIDLDRMSCLEWRRQELETAVAVLLDSTPGDLHLVADAVSSLTPIEVCTDPRALRVLPPPHPDPDKRRAIQAQRIELARAQVLHNSGRHDEALRAANQASEVAAEIDDPALQAEAALLLGEVFAEAGKLREAEAQLERALDAAEAGAHDIVRARALADLVGLTGFALGQPTQRLEARFLAVHERIGELPTRAYVDFMQSLTMTRLGHGQLEAAEKAGREALAEARRLGIDATQARAQLGLALTLLGRYDEAAELLERTAADVDEQHPAAVMVFGIIGIQKGFAGYDQQAVASFQRALAIEAKRELGQPHYRAIVGTYLANSLDRLGQYEQAVQAQEQSIAALRRLWGSEHSSLGRAHYQFGTTLADNGDWERARQNFEASARIWRVTHGPEHRALAQPETGLARVCLHEGDDDRALELLEGAMRKLSQGQGHPAEDARTFFHLARALERKGGERSRALALAERARQTLETLGPGYERDRDRIRAWVASVQASEVSPSEGL